MESLNSEAALSFSPVHYRDPTAVTPGKSSWLLRIAIFIRTDAELMLKLCMGVACFTPARRHSPRNSA